MPRAPSPRSWQGSCCRGAAAQGHPACTGGFRLPWEAPHLPPGSQPHILGVKTGFLPSEDHSESWIGMKINHHSCTWTTLHAFSDAPSSGFRARDREPQGLGPADLVSLTFRRFLTSANLSTFLCNMGDHCCDLLSTLDVPGTVLDFP